jgi:hypothetical protein
MSAAQGSLLDDPSLLGRASPVLALESPVLALESRLLAASEPASPLGLGVPQAPRTHKKRENKAVFFSEIMMVCAPLINASMATPRVTDARKFASAPRGRRKDAIDSPVRSKKMRCTHSAY